MTPEERRLVTTLYQATLLLADRIDEEWAMMLVAELYQTAKEANMLYTDLQIGASIDRLMELNEEGQLDD